MRRLLLLCAGAAQAYREEIQEALTGNLLINGGPDEASMNGWRDVVPGLYNATPPVTAGWAPHIQTEGCETPENPQPCEHVFKTSYQAARGARRCRSSRTESPRNRSTPARSQ